jgi:hypothetical protein
MIDWMHLHIASQTASHIASQPASHMVSMIVFHSIQDSLNEMQERFLMQILMNEYNQERYAWYDFEDDCVDWYMDSCHLRKVVNLLKESPS